MLVNEREATGRERKLGTVASPLRLASLRIVHEEDGQTVLPGRPATPAAEGQVPQTKPKSTVQHFILFCGRRDIPRLHRSASRHGRWPVTARDGDKIPCVLPVYPLDVPFPRMPGGSSERTGQNIRQGDEIDMLLDDMI